jgi:hypothetical protein
MDSRQDQHERGDGRDHPERGQRPFPLCMCDNVDRGDEGAFAGRRGGAECRRDLLQKDDRRDTERESLDDRPRDECDGPAQPDDPGGEYDQPGHDGHDRDAPQTVLRDDRREDYRHRTGRPGYLNVGSAEHRGHQARDDGGDQSGGGAHAGGDAEGQCERQRDDTDGDPGDDVGAPARAQLGVVAGAGQESGASPKHTRRTRAAHARVTGGSDAMASN